MTNADYMVLALMGVAQVEGWVIWYSARKWPSRCIWRALTVGGAQGLLVGSAVAFGFWWLLL